MRDYGKVSTTIWHSEKFRGLRDTDSQLLYFYLLTCPHINSSGCFVLRDGYAIDDLDWKIDRYKRAMEGLSKALLIRFNESQKVVLICNFFAFEPISNSNHAKGTLKAALKLPDCHCKLLVLQDISRQKYVSDVDEIDRAIKGLSDVYRTPEPEPEPEPEPDTKQESFPMVTNPIKKKSDIRFNEFWDAFGDKRGRPGAIKVWVKNKLDKNADFIISKAKIYKQLRDIDDKQCKMAQGWLNDERYNDEIDLNKAARKIGVGGNSGQQLTPLQQMTIYSNRES